MKPHIAVIGGGWAGCAAALTLAEAGAGVTLYEASRTLGGRARAVEVDGRQLDNGQHILLGAYEQTLRLIDRLHAVEEREGLWRLPLALHQPQTFRLACPRLPAPLHLIAGLLGAQGLSWQEKLAAARWIHTLLRSTTTPDFLSVDQLTLAQPEKLRRLLWHPLCVSALNTPPEIASAQVFHNVIRTTFGGDNRCSDLLLPRRDLTTLFPAPAAVRVKALGGQVRLSCRVGALNATPHTVAFDACGEAVVHSHAIVAVAPQHLAGLASSVAELESTIRDVEAYGYQPIATGYVQCDASFSLTKPMFALADGPAQFVFDRGQSHGQPGLMAFVASAATHLAPDWLAQAVAQLQRIVDPGPAYWCKSIVEKQATYACVPRLPRPPVRTSHSRIFLAGDYTAGAYPATLESATRSGVQSARAVLDSL